MKRLLVLLAFVLFTSGSAMASFEPMCGFADELQDFIRASSPEAVSTKIFVKGQQGETGRFIRIFTSGSWVITFEFFSDGPPDKDVSCLVAAGAGGDEQAVDFVTRLVPSLPEKRFKDFGKDPQDLLPLASFVPAN